MKLNEVKCITIDLENGRYVKLLQTFAIKQTVGAQGDLLSCPKNEQMIFVPPGAVQLDTEIEATFYRVIDSVGLNSSEFVTNLVEITPHELWFKKPVEILMRHHLFVEDDSSNVTVLFHSGKVTDNIFTSLCQLSSVDESSSSNFMKMTLWEDFVHIETFHLCRFDLLCEGNSYIEVWASIYTLKIPSLNQFHARLTLTSNRPDPNDEKFTYIAGGKLECRYSTLLTLTCAEKQDLQVTVRIPSNAKGWSPMEESDRRQTISYRDIQNVVVQDRPHLSTDFVLVKDKSSNVDVKDFAPVFTFNGFRCILPPSTCRSTSDLGTYSSGTQQTNSAGNKLVHLLKLCILAYYKIFYNLKPCNVSLDASRAMTIDMVAPTMRDASNSVPPEEAHLSSRSLDEASLLGDQCPDDVAITGRVQPCT